MALDDQLKDFGSLVGLVLALIALFTSARARVVEDRRLDFRDRKRPPPGVSYKRARNEVFAIDFVLYMVTAGLFVAGLPLMVEAIDQAVFLSREGAIPVAFALCWLLVLGLAVWQAVIVFYSHGVAHDIEIVEITGEIPLEYQDR